MKFMFSLAAGVSCLYDYVVPTIFRKVHPILVATVLLQAQEFQYDILQKPQHTGTIK